MRDCSARQIGACAAPKLVPGRGEGRPEGLSAPKAGENLGKMHRVFECFTVVQRGAGNPPLK